jgi:hypothetical protein
MSTGTRCFHPHDMAREFRMHNNCSPQVHERLTRWHAADWYRKIPFTVGYDDRVSRDEQF